MNYRELGEIDLKLRLQSGSPIAVDNLVIKPYTLREIIDYRFSEYMSNLQWISVSIDDFINSILDDSKRAILEEDRDELKTYDFYTTLGGSEMTERLMQSLSMLFRTQDIHYLKDGAIAINFEKMGVLYYDEDGELAIDEEYLNYLNEDEVTLIHRDNFDDIVEVAKLQNYLTKPKKADENTANPADEETRKLMEVMEKHRKRVEQKKKAQQQSEKSGDEDIDISDITSAVSSKSNSINKFNIWDLTLYQVYDEYSRLELIDNYDFSIRAMMAGAENVDLKHWSSRL